MSHGIKLLASYCEHPDGFKEFMRLTPRKDDFVGEHETVVFDHIYKHVNLYGSLPKWQTVLDDGKKKGWEFALPGLEQTQNLEPPAYYHDRVSERRVHRGVKAALQDATKLLNGDNPYEAMELLMQRAQELQMRSFAAKLMNYAQDGADAIKLHLAQMAKGESTGLMFGWPYLDGMTGGLVGGDVCSIIGRPAQGKTFMLLKGALHGWKHQNRRPLVVSMEMKNAVVTQRLAAMDTKIALTHLKTGQLDTKKQAAPMMAQLTANKTKQPFYIVDGALAVNVPQIKMLMQQLQPTDLWIDGAYLLRHENSRLGRWEKVTDNAERIKSELAEGFGIPATISYQFNREATKKKEGAPGVEDIAYTDAIGQLSSLVLGMMQEESVETMRKRTVSIMKGRSGEVGQFNINWSFAHPDAMNFDQYVEPSISELSYM